MESHHYCGFVEAGVPCANLCSPLDKFCWRHKNLNRECPITGEPVCKCKYHIDPISEPTVKETLRKLFTDHVNFTHLYIISEIFELPNLKPVTDRLLQNQVDIGLAVQKVYDVKKGKILIELLKEHILRVSAAVKVAKQLKEAEINIRGVMEAEADLEIALENVFKNSADVSGLLSSLDPIKLPFDVVLSHFDEHNQYVIDLAKLYIDGKYEEAVKEYDCYFNHGLHFSDMLAYPAES